jgi:3-hydroxyisobutyrate dehydrogenase
MSTVAVIGLGRMGGPMADNVIRAGHDVRVFDVAEAAVATRVAAGGTRAASIAEACEGAEIVAVVVYDDAQVLAVVNGAGGVLDALTPGAVVLIHTTVTLDTIEAVAEAAATGGVRVLDVGISGGESGATDGTLVVMVGGDPEALAIARPVLDTYSGEVVHAGPQGAGMAVKLLRNAVGYMLMAATHEALHVAEAAGVDGATLRHVLEATDLPKMLYSPFAFGSAAPLGDDAPAELVATMEHVARTGRKDLAQALALAARHGAPMPAAVATRDEMHAITRLASPPPD